MPLPTFRSLAARRQAQKAEKEDEMVTPAEPTMGAPNSDQTSDRTLTAAGSPTVDAAGVDIKKATSTRRNAIIISSIFFLISVVFLILTMIGNINTKVVIRSTYFIKLNLTNIIPVSAGSSVMLVNSLARSLGLHDFYQVGLWNFCEGYNDQGITYCSKPKTLYWFNPVEILLNELLAGATIALPAEINNILGLIRIASHLMFGFFLTGVCMNFVNIFLAPVVLYSRWISLPFAIWTFISALLTTAATIIATVMFVIFRNVLTSQAGLNIGASLGNDMFAFMWIGSAFSIFGFVIHLCLSCCGASRRDEKTGKRRGNKKAYSTNGVSTLNEKSPSQRRKFAMPKFVRRRTAGQAV